eukprot:4329575-Prorocentrum_lima.AAC.1
MTSSLVGSEMCIRDSLQWALLFLVSPGDFLRIAGSSTSWRESLLPWLDTVSYTHLTLPTICSV